MVSVQGGSFALTNDSTLFANGPQFHPFISWHERYGPAKRRDPVLDGASVLGHLVLRDIGPVKTLEASST